MSKEKASYANKFNKNGSKSDLKFKEKLIKCIHYPIKFCSSLKLNNTNNMSNKQEPEDFYRPVMSTMIDPQVMLTFSPDTVSTIDSITTTNSTPELVRRQIPIQRPLIYKQDDTLIDQNESPLTYFEYEESFEHLQSTKIDFQSQDNPIQKSLFWPLSPMTQIQSTKSSQEILSSTEYFSVDNSEDIRSEEYQKAQITQLIDSLSEYHETNTYVCHSSYDASFVGDITVQFADTVKIIRECNNDWLVVKVSETGQEGYVPKNIVIDLQTFLKKLKDFQKQLDSSLEQSYIFPVKV